MAKKIKPKDNCLPDRSEISEIDPEIYNSIARCAQLLAVQLIDSSFSIDPSYFDHEIEGKLKVDYSDVHSSFDQEERVATCIFHLETMKKKGNKKLFSLKDKFVVFYHIAAECDDFHANAFAKKVGFVACYPYFRAHFAQTASFANADMPILPTVASMPVKKVIKEAVTS